MEAAEVRGAADAWTTLEARTVAALRAAARALEDGADAAGVVESTLAPLAESWRGVHATLSRAGRSVERVLGPPLVPLCPGLAADGALLDAAVGELYREGLFAAGDVLAAEAGAALASACGDDSMRPGMEGAWGAGHAELRAACAEMHALREALAVRRDVRPADAWAAENAALLGPEGERLRFQLHCLAFIALLRPPALGSGVQTEVSDGAEPSASCAAAYLGSDMVLDECGSDAMQPSTRMDVEQEPPQQASQTVSQSASARSSPGAKHAHARPSLERAVEYARTHLAPFYGRYAADVQALLGAAAYGGRAGGLERSPYAGLLAADLWGEAEDMLVGAYCRARGLPAESPLRLAHATGEGAWPRVSRVLALVREKQPGAAPPDELPVEVPLAPHHRFHSVFVCPVLRQPASAENPPVAMACGHVISAEALGRLSKGNAAYRFKCPYCPQESTAAQAFRLYL